MIRRQRPTPEGDDSALLILFRQSPSPSYLHLLNPPVAGPVPDATSVIRFLRTKGRVQVVLHWRGRRGEAGRPAISLDSPRLESQLDAHHLAPVGQAQLRYSTPRRHHAQRPSLAQAEDRSCTNAESGFQRNQQMVGKLLWDG